MLPVTSAANLEARPRTVNQGAVAFATVPDHVVVDRIAALAIYPASDESAFTTGAIRVIDGGPDSLIFKVLT